MIAPLASTTTPDSVPVGPDCASELITGEHMIAMSKCTIVLRILLKFAVNINRLLSSKLFFLMSVQKSVKNLMPDVMPRQS
jgi:hypothetical protein